MAGPKGTPEGELLEKTRTTTRRPAPFRVILHNDDYTTMEFVIRVLMTIFAKGPAEAYRVMMAVHTQGSAVCGVYTFEEAETKVVEVHEAARSEGYPLRASLEEEG